MPGRYRRGVTDLVHAPLEAVKPRLRGWLHAGATPLVLAAGIVLICLAPTTGFAWAALVYTLAGLILFGTSATYHLGTWSPRVRARLKRADHANIYLIIAGSYTPIALLALDGWHRTAILVGVWIGAALGVVFRVLWTDAPRALYTGLYIVLGWCIAPFADELFAAGVAPAVLTVAGGVLYTIGGVVYALKRPDPRPAWFGFHEVFHAFTIGAWTCQYVAVSLLAYR